MAEFGERYSGGEDYLAGPGPRLQTEQNQLQLNTVGGCVCTLVLPANIHGGLTPSQVPCTLR